MCSAPRPLLQRDVLQDLVPQEGFAPEEPELLANIAAQAGHEVVQHCKQKSHIWMLGSAEGSAGWSTCASLCPYLTDVRLGVLPASHTIKPVWFHSLGQGIQCKARDFCSLYFNEFYAF